MAIYVEIDGLENKLEFPDGTSRDVIQSVVNKLTNKKEAPRLAGGIVGRVPEVYMEEIKSGQSAMKKMVEEPTGISVINGVLGALRYGFAPITAVSKGYVRQGLVEPILDASGIKGKTREFIGDLSETAADFIPYGGLVNKSIKALKTAEEATALSEVARTASKGLKDASISKKPLQFPSGIKEETIREATEPISETQKAVLREDVVKDVISEVKKHVSEKWVPVGEKRITQEVVDYLMKNKENIPNVIEKYGMSPEQFAAHMKETMSTSGRQLNQMAQWAKEIRASFKTPEMQRLADYMDKLLPDSKETQAIDRFFGGWKKIENVRRGLLVSQIATAMRNAVSQTGRLAIGALDDSVKGVISGVTSGGTLKETTQETLKGIGEGLDTVTALINKFKPSSREKFLKILETDNAITSKANLYGSPVHEVSLGNKISKAVNVLNRAQEFFFRDIAFQAKLNQLLKKSGVKRGIKEIDPKNIPESMLEEATSYALEMTFASMPKSEFGKQWVKFMSNPIMTSLINPFPRFMYGNALPFLKDFSPVGFLNAVSPKVVAELASGNPEKFAKAASRATIGTAMFTMANWLRSSEYAGEKWYEVNLPNGKRLDTRAFAPLNTYLFLAEAIQNPERLSPSDFGQAIFSMNRIAGTGLVLTDIMRGKTVEDTSKIIGRLAGEYVGSFTTPLRTVKDIYSGVDEKEAIIRDTKESPLVGPLTRNIPVVSQRLPKKYSPLKSEPLKSESPLFRQLTGFSTKTKTLLEKEVDKINLPYESIYPRTGEPEGDREIIKVMGPIAERFVPKVIESKVYKESTNKTKVLILNNIFQIIKKQARMQVMKTNPELAFKIKINNIPRIQKDVLREIGVNIK